VQLHGGNGNESDDSKHKTLYPHGDEETGPLTVDEVTIMRGAMALSENRADSILTPLKDVFMLPFDGILDKETLKIVSEKNHSRIPVYKDSRDYIVGMILTKTLVLLDPNSNVCPRSLCFYLTI